MSTDSPLLARGLRTLDAAKYVGLSEAFLRKARLGKTKVQGPIFKRIGSRVVYLREDLDAFLDVHESSFVYQQPKQGVA